MLIESGPFKGLVRNGYRVIAVDPPWKFITRSDKGLGRSAERHYHCMTLDDIKALPIADLAAKDCVLLIWVTDPMIRQAWEVVEAWGFRYTTVAFYWGKTTGDGSDKDHFGMGYWTRANPEQAWSAALDMDDGNQVHMFAKGHPKRQARNVRRWIVSPVREHSRKPDEFFDRTERLLSGPYLELFSREDRPGWTTWGNEVGKFRRAQWDDNLSPDLAALIDGLPDDLFELI